MNDLFSSLPNTPQSNSQGPVQVFCDGGSRGNPGNAGAGFAILEEGQEIARGGENCGHQTNNYAEYRSLILALEKLVELNRHHADIFMDSKLAIEQMKGNWKVKNINLKPLFETAKNIIQQQNLQLTFTHIYREKNTLADSIANEYMDQIK